MFRVLQTCLMIFLLLVAHAALAQKNALNDFNVNRIKLRGVQNHESQGINQDTLEDKVNTWRIDDFPTKRLTLANLQDLAYRISKYYQDLGFSFVAATVPKQKIRRGVVVIQVREDKLSDVQIRNVSDSQRLLMIKEFRGMIGRPVFKPDLEEPILLLNDNPNREVFAYFSRGKNKGDPRTNLNVKQTRFNGMQMGVNNNGSPSTGTDKWWLAANMNNPFGWDDAFHMNVSQSIENQNNVSGTFSYKTFSGSRGEYTYSLTRNQYQLGEDLESLKLSGEYTSFLTQYRKKSKRTFSNSQSQIYSLELRQSELTSGVLNLDQSDSALIGSYQDASTDYQIVFGDFLTKSLQVSVIALTEENEQLSDSAFVKFNGFFQSGINIGSYIPGLNTRFTSKLNLQYSPQVLPSADKKSLTGINGVRAFESGVFSSDEAMVIQLQLSAVYPSKVGKFEPYGFYDHGYGIRKALEDEVGAELSGMGVGLKFQFYKWLNLDASYAVSNTAKIGSLEQDEQSVFLFSMTSQLF